MICENCNKEHEGSYGSGRFCCIKCARGFATKYNRVEISNKVSDTLLKRRETTKYKTDFSVRYCKLCNKQLGRRNVTGLCYDCSNKNRTFSQETKKKISDSIQTRVKNGTWKGWKSRNIISYSERFWAKVLDNNKIKYIREKKVGKYFLDFVIGNIDLEIDGKQHRYKDRIESDRIRDGYLTECGFVVYRIEWNEINSYEGKQKMRRKIEDFLLFVKNYTD